MPELSFHTGPATVTFAADGAVTSFTTPARSAASHLSRSAQVQVEIDGAPVVWRPPAVAVDADELELTYDCDVEVRAVVRHTFDPSWTVRLRLVNLGAAARVLDAVRLTWVAAEGNVSVALAAGAAASYAVQPASGRGPVLVGRLVSGVQPGVDATALGLGGFTLAPGASRVAQWRWEVVGTARRAGPAVGLPRTGWLEPDQVVVLPAGPDVAVVAPGLVVDVGPDTVELAADEAGSYAVELRSARGTTALVLDWADDLDDLVDVATARAAAAPAGPAGAPRLDGAADGLLLQDALARQSLDEPRRVEDALDLLAGELAERAATAGAGALDPLGLAFLAREAERADDDSLLELARRGLLAAEQPAPGLGLAAARVCLSLVRSGRGVGGVTRHLTGVVAAGARLRSPDAAAAYLELALLVGPREPTATDPAVTDALLRVGAELGAGLPGRRLDPLPVDVVAHLAAVLALVGEAYGEDLRAWWGIGAAELARRSAAEARCRVGAEPYGPGRAERSRALAWLVLGASLT